MRRPVRILRVVALVVALALGLGLPPSGPGSPVIAAAATRDSVTILAGAPESIDPAHHGDLGSAQYVSQLYESLTAIDATLTVQPALAAGWTVGSSGQQVVFRLRPNLVFSDGTPLTSADVVRSWRRLFTPDNPSPLASLLANVVGARDLLAGRSTDTSTLGVRTEGDDRVIVDLVGGGGDLAAIVSGAPFGIVPASVGAGEIPLQPGGVGSGGYLLSGVTADELTLHANPRYWAGKPAIATVRALTTLGGHSLIDAFSAGDVDVSEIGSFDASWIGYDRTLGPSLRRDPSLTVTYYGFDASRKPFDDARVRRAFAMAVDWRRLAQLDDPGTSAPATSIVPAGIPGTPAGDFLPPYDPEGARTVLAQAGYAHGSDLPAVTFIGSGGGYDEAIVTMLRQNLGVTIDYGTMDFTAYSRRLDTDPPQLWSISWAADYPGPNDFLGVLLETGSTANQGRWSNAAFDQAIAEATAAGTPAAATAAYAKALGIVRDEVPVVPVSYGTSFSLVRDGLLGAAQNGLGITRLAGLAWK